MYTKQALSTIYTAITPQGILASSIQKDNYAKIWSRDSMMTGIAGLLINDEKIITAHKNSILTLAKYQAETGQIPSNVLIKNGEAEVSYGSLVGRVDATTWWIIGTCLYLKTIEDIPLKQKLLPNIKLALQCLKTWEFNNRGLIYTPLGGNWADEYITNGYTLYDNVLRFWALDLASEIFENTHWKVEAINIKKLIENNFSKKLNAEPKYHPTAYKKVETKPYYYSHFSANGYETLFDMAGNALAIYLDFDLNLNDFENYLSNLNQEFKHWMLPVFYPIIKQNNKNWQLLENNYSFLFKNKPYHFHNGGSWPIFLGWLCLALNKRKHFKISKLILKDYENLLNKNNEKFSEYFATDNLEVCGTEKLCFSAVGYLLMKIEHK